MYIICVSYMYIVCVYTQHIYVHILRYIYIYTLYIYECRLIKLCNLYRCIVLLELIHVHVVRPNIYIYIYIQIEDHNTTSIHHFGIGLPLG